MKIKAINLELAFLRKFEDRGRAIEKGICISMEILFLKVKAK